MPNTRRHSYDLNFKLKIVEEAEAVKTNREIAREYGISESMVRKWRNQQHILFTGELKMTANRASMGRYRPKDPELDQQLADWFSDQRSQGKNYSHTPNAICLPHENATALYYTNSKFNYVKTKQHRYVIKNDNHDCSLFSHCSLNHFLLL